MPASSKVWAAYCSYAVSIVNLSPRSFISRRWCVRTFFTWAAGPEPLP